MRELPGAQQSDRWLKNRLGRITASRICDVMAVLKKGGESAARRNYRMELVAERLTNRAAEHYNSIWMQRGNDLEAEARELYELAAKTMVEPVGFVLHPTFDFAGASPDGLLGNDGLLEIKCPKTETLLEWMDLQQVPEEYYLQMQWEMACTERQWGHFFGYSDCLPPGSQHLVIEVQRDDEKIAEIEREVVKLDAEVEAFIARRGLPPTRWIISAFETEGTYDHSADFLTNAARAIGEQEIPV